MSKLTLRKALSNIDEIKKVNQFLAHRQFRAFLKTKQQENELTDTDKEHLKVVQGCMIQVKKLLLVTDSEEDINHYSYNWLEAIFPTDGFCWELPQEHEEDRGEDIKPRFVQQEPSRETEEVTPDQLAHDNLSSSLSGSDSITGTITADFMGSIFSANGKAALLLSINQEELTESNFFKLISRESLMFLEECFPDGSIFKVQDQGDITF